ncbi:serine/threonine-protein kinase [Actinokineospora sp. UTMC 2448]|uniref:serine/threonine-protein kinase n=1 Tax=Actinokineospora sp. UTMC 2448 TaxID=2268449 RepID=UPI0021649EEB|nr:serine/threonine-protein kinase [Actinokineospora sp. UTMC 2448]UVS81869.1 Serine/threonine-protein kinase PrkC [Actinokineospora sp. UTMC 2448]
MAAVSTSEQRLIAGRYRVRGLIGQGAMGVVWSAYDEHLRRPVAVKEVRRQPGVTDAEAAELRERTLREARAIAVLAHPNVVTLHDVVSDGDEPFVVMEYVQAPSLAQLLRLNGACTDVQAAVIGSAVAAGLLAAHAAGITHRDVKPGNVLVGTDGTVKLTDFGIARNVSERTLTRSGVMLGSPAYIAPEVVSGGRVTPAADLWGLGATLFAAVDGRAPYDPDAPVLETLHRVVDGEVPVPEHDGPLRAVITGLMVKDPEARMSLQEVRELLHPLLPAPGRSVFADLKTSAEDAATVVTRPAPAPEPAPEPPGETSAPLALAPGPLPFAPAVRTRGAVAAAVLTLVAALLFAGGAAGGFALARVVGGEPVLPRTTTTTVPVPDSPVTELVVRSADASTLAGEQGGAFSVPVPEDWVKFVEQRTPETLPNSTRVHWVAPTGTAELVVERFPEYTAKHTIEDYLSYLASRVPAYRPVGETPLDDGGLRLTYRTVESFPNAPGGPAPDLTRVTFADVHPRGADLWVVSLTVPIEQEDSARSGLFADVVAGFQVGSA